LHGFSPASVAVTFDVMHPQQQLSWDADIMGEDDASLALLAGSSSLMCYPTVCTLLDPQGVPASQAGARVLRQMIICLALETDAFDKCDGVGANPIHALLVCNTPESLALSMELYRLCPRLLTQLHAPTGPFSGESCLHVTAVNRREGLLVELVELAVEHLKPNEVRTLLCTQTRGCFFEDAPMRFYGSTVLSYCCVFDLRLAVQALLQTGHVDLNRREDSCRLSGFLPIHAVIASSNVPMYEFLTTELPRELRCDAQNATYIGRLEAGLEFACLTPLQLAASLGDRSLVRHILRKQCEVMWKWGPVTQFALDLRGIDSTGQGSGDLMELIVRLGARDRTCEMLLDTFMNGFIYQLFLDKWRRFGRRLHYIHRLLDVLLIVLILTQTFAVKGPAEPFDRSDTAVKALSMTILVIMCNVAVLEARTIMLFVRNENQGSARGESEHLPLRAILKKVWHFMKQHKMLSQMLAYHFVIIGEILLMTEGMMPRREWQLVDRARGLINQTDFEGNQTHLGHAHFGLEELAMRIPGEEIVDEGAWALFYMTQAIAILLLVLHNSIMVLQPFEKPSIMIQAIYAMVVNDLLVWIIVFLAQFTAFYAALFILYPRSGTNELPFAPDFNHLLDSFLALLQLALIGEGVDIPAEALRDRAFSQAGTLMSLEQTIAIWLWVVLYYIYVLVCLILMLNLLIAMLTTTFEAVQEAATLKSRLDFAVAIMKLEPVASSLGMRTRVGEKFKDMHVHIFRAVEKDDNNEDEERVNIGVDEGGSDPFAAPVQSEKRLFTYVQKNFAELDEKMSSVLEALASTSQRLEALASTGQQLHHGTHETLETQQQLTHSSSSPRRRSPVQGSSKGTARITRRVAPLIR